MKKFFLLIAFVACFSCKDKDVTSSTISKEYEEKYQEAYLKEFMRSEKFSKQNLSNSYLDSAIKYSPDYYKYYMLKMQHFASIDSFYLAIKYAEIAQDKKDAWFISYAIAMMYYVVENYDSSFFYFKKAAKQMEKAKKTDDFNYFFISYFISDNKDTIKLKEDLREFFKNNPNYAPNSDEFFYNVIKKFEEDPKDVFNNNKI